MNGPSLGVRWRLVARGNPEVQSALDYADVFMT
jgi:hypothetical protein